MRNSSQNAGCMRRWLRSPAGASHCCHDRVLVCTTAEAAAWVSPAASRAALTCSGVGLDAGPFCPLFGWFATLAKIGFSHSERNRGSDTSLFLRVDGADSVLGSNGTAHLFGGIKLVLGGVCRNNDARHLRLIVNANVCQFGLKFFSGHFLLQPLIPRRGGLRCASHELNYTRNARKRKNFFENFSRGPGDTAKPSNASFSREPERSGGESAGSDS